MKVKSELALCLNQSNPEAHVLSLKLRIETFLSQAEPKLSEIMSELRSANSSTLEILNKFGDKCVSTDFGDDDADVVKAFFTLLTTFARSFQNTIIENQNQRLEAEKAKAVSDGNKSSGTSATADGGKTAAAVTTTAARDNLFGNFQKAQGQGASADQLINEFKKKLQNKFKNNRDSLEFTSNDSGF